MLSSFCFQNMKGMYMASHKMSARLRRLITGAIADKLRECNKCSSFSEVLLFLYHISYKARLFYSLPLLVAV
jgi:hypothetical protein